jgi:hypothetical protein
MHISIPGSKHFTLEPVWFIHVELAARDDARVREAGD